MSQGSDFKINIETRLPIHHGNIATGFLEEWCSESLPAIRPERWGKGEPARHVIQDTSLADIISTWTQVPLIFRRLTPPRLTLSFNWRFNVGRDTRPYPWDAVGWMARSAGDAAAVELLRLLIKHFSPGFGSLTTDQDSRDRHLTDWPHVVNGQMVGKATGFRGNHVGATLPGIYWRTYFGPDLVTDLGIEGIIGKIPSHAQICGEGVLLQPYERSQSIGTPSARYAEEELMNLIGINNFYRRGLDNTSPSRSL